jgi:aminoglycoside 6'-N-acetyltransferase I
MQMQDATPFLTLREVLPVDRAEWLRLRDALMPAEDNAREIDEFFAAQAEYGVFVIARSAGGLGGFVEVGTRDFAEGCSTSPVAYIEAWYIDADLRRRGLGRALLTRAEAWAVARGLTEIGSDAVVDNTLSIDVHRAVGYDEAERIVCFRKML